MSDVRLRTEDLSVGYNGRELIRGIALSLRPGEIMTLIGPNGAGKSTILKSVIRQLALVRGTVCLDGRDMAGLREGDVARRMSVVMTSHISPELMTCFDVAATGRYPYTGRLGILSREDREKVAKSFRIFFRAIGDKDPFLEYFKEDDVRCEKSGIRQERRIYEGIHDWNVWRQCIRDFAQLIFRP